MLVLFLPKTLFRPEAQAFYGDCWLLLTANCAADLTYVCWFYRQPIRL